MEDHDLESAMVGASASHLPRSKTVARKKREPVHERTESSMTNDDFEQRINAALASIAVVDDDDDDDSKRRRGDEDDEDDEPEKPVDVKKLFIQIGDDVKKVEFKASPPILPAVKSLFAKKFKFKLRDDYDFPPVYIKDPDSDTFYEFEKPFVIEEKSTLRLQLTDDYEDPRNEGVNKKGTTNFKKLLKEMETLKDAVMGKSHKSNSEVEKAILEIETKHKFVNQKRQKFIQERVELQTKAVTDLRKELAAVKTVYLQSTSDLLKQLQDLKKAVSATTQAIEKNSKENPRSTFNGHKALINQVLATVPGRLEELNFLLEEAKKDVLKRKCEPAPGRMAFLELQSTEIQDQMDKVLDLFSKENKHKWKKIWEQELANIVAEQNALKTQERQCEDIDEKLNTFLDGYDEVQRVLEMLKKTGGFSKEAFVPALPPPDVGDVDGDLKDMLLTQIKTQTISAEQRMKALEAAEKTRAIEKMMKKGNEFEEELKGFVGNKKFKKQGGFEEIERIRQERDRENMKNSLKATDAPMSAE